MKMEKLINEMKNKYKLYDLLILKPYEIGDVAKDIHDKIITDAIKQNRELSELESIVVEDCESMYPFILN